MTLNKHRVKKIISQIQYFIKNHRKKITYKRMYDGSCGYYYIEEDRIEIDPTQDVLTVLVHEVLHRIFADLKEKEILKLEQIVINNMTARQALSIIRCI